METARLVFIIVCVLQFVSAVIMLILGAVLHCQESDNVKLIGVRYLPAFNVLIAAGVSGIIAFILGLIGTLKTKKVLIYVFLGFMALIFILALVAGILGFVYCEKVDEKIDDNLKSSLDKYGVTGESKMTKLWDAIQKEKACCAVYFFTDWRTTEFAHNRYDKVPQSCCKKASTGCTGYEFKIDEINDKGCGGPLRTSVLEDLQGASIAGIILALLELILIILAAYYLKTLGKKGGSHDREMESRPQRVPTSDPDYQNKPSEFL